MTELISFYIAELKKIDWQDIQTIEPSDEISFHWLLEKGSLSRRLEKICSKLSVTLLHNSMISSDQMTADEKGLLSDSRCLLREVVLTGDDKNWVIGRTLIPETSLEKQPYDLLQQGTIPLGLTIFSVDDVKRDALEYGWVELPEGRLIARRSRLWMNQKPILVAELFLPGAPVYLRAGQQ